MRHLPSCLELEPGPVSFRYWLAQLREYLYRGSLYRGIAINLWCCCPDKLLFLDSDPHWGRLF